jgi:hypothetical protein
MSLQARRSNNFYDIGIPKAATESQDELFANLTGMFLPRFTSSLVTWLTPTAQPMRLHPPVRKIQA